MTKWYEQKMLLVLEGGCIISLVNSLFVRSWHVYICLCMTIQQYHTNCASTSKEFYINGAYSWMFVSFAAILNTNYYFQWHNIRWMRHCSCYYYWNDLLTSKRLHALTLWVCFQNFSSLVCCELHQFDGSITNVCCKRNELLKFIAPHIRWMFRQCEMKH